MNRLFNNKRKKSPESFPQGTVPKNPTDNAAGPVSHQAQSNISPEDDRSGGGSRITFQDRMDENQELPAPIAWTSGVVIGGTERRNENTGDTGGRLIELTEASRVAKRARRGTILGGLAIPVDVPKEAADGFGPLKAILGAIPAVYANFQETLTIGDKIEGILSHIVALEARFAIRPHDATEQRRRLELIRKFERVEGQLQSLVENSQPRQQADHVQDDEEVSRLLEDMREIIPDYQMVQQMTVHEQGCKLISAVEAAILNSFRCAQGTEYRHGDCKGCLKGTREAVLDKIESWARDFNKSPVYWLNGLAGTGKSTIAQTIAERMFADGQLGASFFCSRDFEDRSSLQLIFPTVAVQLARKYSDFRSLFVPLVRSDPGIAHESLYNQIDKLIMRPLRELHFNRDRDRCFGRVQRRGARFCDPVSSWTICIRDSNGQILRHRSSRATHSRRLPSPSVGGSNGHLRPP